MSSAAVHTTRRDSTISGQQGGETVEGAGARMLEEVELDDVPILDELPPRESWEYSGSMSKKVREGGRGRTAA